MRWHSTITALAVLLTSCASAAASADIAGLRICSTLTKIPKGFRASGDCDRMSPLDNCTFTLQSDGNRISYFVESGVIKSKTFKLEAKTTGPFALTTLDTPKSAKIKVKAATKLSMKLYTEPEIFLQSSEQKCAGNVYNIVIYFNSKQRAEEVAVSSLPVI